MKVLLLPGVLAWFVAVLASTSLNAQYPGLAPAAAYQYGGLGDRPGRYPVGPASFEEGQAMGPGLDGGGYCGAEGCGPGGCGGGCGRCGDGCGDSLSEFGGRPRWFNVAFDAIYLTREEVSRSIDFTTSGNRATNPFAPVVLSTDNLDFDAEPGFRITFQFICGPGANLEANYFGTLFYNSSARATGNDNLFSAFSSFGATPLNGFNDTDQAELHTLDYKTRFDSGELNYRVRFMSPNNRIQTSLLAGVRYVRVDEDFLFNSTVNRGAMPVVTGNMAYRTRTNNDLTGFQLGGDLSVSATRCLTFGGEVKAGLFGNHAVQETTIIATVPAAGTTTESASHESAAFVSEANIFLVLNCTEHIAVRGGYQMVYVDSIALAPENVNFTRAANGSFANRLVSIDDTGNLFLHGVTFGFEVTW